VDFSLRLLGFSEHDPIVFENRDIRGYWPVIFCDNLQGIKRRMQRTYDSGGRGVFYQTDRKMRVTTGELETDMPKFFSPSEKTSPVRYGSIVSHCERLLEGGDSLTSVPQWKAWEFLSATYS
jgi:hypothetical protein